jgi:NhaP-type Na+/H+ and K+/H+ antiporter
MYKYIGLLRQTGLSDGFMLNGNSSLQSLARFYGLRSPASQPTMTVADYLARNCYGQPRIGDRAVWERVELVVEELHDQTISKVRLALLPLHDRRVPPPAAQMHGGRRGAKERRNDDGRASR